VEGPSQTFDTQSERVIWELINNQDVVMLGRFLYRGRIRLG
jgi:hypothetical protein